jgi:predicted nucleic acid-binding Zn finger protein
MTSQEMVNEVIKMSQTKETYKVQSSSDINVYYIVRMVDGTPLFCSCPDFMNRGGSKNPYHVCKHMRMVVVAEITGNIITIEEKNAKQRLQYQDDEYDF